jgi:hypothetical protein
MRTENSIQGQCIGGRWGQNTMGNWIMAMLLTAWQAYTCMCLCNNPWGDTAVTPRPSHVC